MKRKPTMVFIPMLPGLIGIFPLAHAADKARPVVEPKPNILVIWGDDIGTWISVTTTGA